MAKEKNLKSKISGFFNDLGNQVREGVNKLFEIAQAQQQQSGGATQTQGSTQSTGDGNTSGVQSSGVFLPGISDSSAGAGSTVKFNDNTQKFNYIMGDILPRRNESGDFKYSDSYMDMANQKPVELPGISIKEATEQSNKNIDDMYHHIHFMNTLAGRIETKERVDKYGDSTKSELRPRVKVGVKQPINNWKKFGNTVYNEAENLSANFNKFIVDYIPKSRVENRIGREISDDEYEASIFSIKKYFDKEVKRNQNDVLKYNEKINNAFEKYKKKTLNPEIEKLYEDKTITELLEEGDMGGAWYKMLGGASENWTSLVDTALMIVHPVIGTVAMGTDTFAQESTGEFEDLINHGATYEEARNGAILAGGINTAVELFLERWLGGAQQTTSKFLRKTFMKEAKKEIVKNIAKKGWSEILGRSLWEWGRSSFVEGLEEFVQNIVGNTVIKMVDPDQNIFEGGWKGFDAGFWNPINIIGGGSSILNDYSNNKKVEKQADLEALDYVLEGEKRKAQRIEQQKEKMRQRANAIKNPTMDNGYTPTPEQAEQRANEREENEQFEDEMKRENQEGPNYTEEDEQRFTREGIEEQQQADELRAEQNREMQIENDMMNEVLNEGDLNEDLGDPRYQKSDSPQSVSEDTVREKSRTGNVSISSENSSEISKNLNEIKKNLEDLKADTFLQQIKKSISGDEKNSNYITNRINGNKYVLRIADHHANAKNSKKSPYNNTSIVVKLVKRKNNGKNIQFKKYKSVDMMEFVYNPENMTPTTMQGIIEGIQNWIKTGEYTDTNYDSKNQSTRKIGENKTEEKYQLKYEEEGYNPGVAGKNEKNISGKEGVNLRNKLNKKTVKELAEKYGIKVEVIEGMIKILENGKRKGYAYGKYIDQLLTLSEQIKESTAPHELLHAIFDMIDPETKTYLISQVMKSEGWSASKAEERLADSFSNFFRTGKIEGAPKSTWGKIKIFFKRVRSFINGMGRWRNQLDEIFTDIIESEGIEDLQGKIDRNERINKAKEKMRERFKQYQKNAEKMQKKSESENKYQEAEDQTQSKAFKKRFGDSKVVDENGNPLVVYHGTEMKFNTFGRGNGEHGKGFYFTDDMDYAEEFSGEDGNTMEVYLKMVNPLRESVDMNSKEMKNLIKGIKEKRGLSERQIKDCFVNEDWSSELSSKIAKKMGYGKKDVEKTVGWEFEDIDEIGETDYNAYLGAYAWENGLNDLVRESGFDGIISKIYNSDAEGLEYIAFKPNQIKSATDNVGTYDANNDDIRYQKADIDPEATSPEDLIEVNDKGLDVMVKFVSEKQKKNATDVNKELLTDNGNPYMWTSTNKYKSKVITDWRNVEDSKYKEYTDKGIQVARFTNNSSMSYSYAGYKSKLAPVKKFKSIDELNKFFKENPNNYERILGNGIDDGVLKSSVVYEMKENDGKFELISNSTETLTQSMKDFYDGINNDWFGGNIGEMPENKDEALKKLQEYYNEHDYEIDGERTVKLLKNGNVERTVVKEPTVYKRFNTKLDALAEGYTIAQEADLYHYQGVIQKMKNPLVVDIRSKDNTPSTWSRLGTVNDIFDKEGINYNKEVDYYIRDVEEAMDGFSERMKALEQYWNDAYRDDPYGEVSQFMGNVQLSANNGVTYMVDELEDLLNDPAMGEDLKIGLDTEVYGDLRDYGRTLRDVIIELRNFINTDRNYYALKKLSPEGIESWIKDMGAPKEVVKMIKNKNWKDMLGNWRDIGDKGWRENIKELLTTNGMDLETNDWVRYALDSGKYDGVIFKNIIDYGGLPKEGWENAKGGDVAVTFRSNQFKTWDNEDPTDSKYIRYQRVYHGSPAEFEKFDSSHMGEGEGDQVHGRGHYVAVDPKTGKEYAETLAGPRYKGKEMYELASDLPGYQWNVINHVAEQMRDGVDIENAIANDKKWHEYLLNKAEENLKTEKDEDNIDYLEREIKQQKEMIKIADGLKVSDFETSRGRRNFYEVEIPDIVDADTPTGTNYFEENKVLTRSEIEKILNKLLKRKTQGAERVKNAIDYDLKDGEKIDGRAMVFNLRAGLGNKKASKFLESLGYDGIHYFGGKDGEAYVIFNDDNLEIKNHEKYQKVEYEYDENGNPKRIKFGDNSEFDPSIFGENTREEQIEEDKENEKGNPFYNAWMRYNNQNYKDDQKTFEEFMKGLSDRADKEQEIYDEKMKSLSEAQNDPQLLDLQLRAVKLMEEEGNVGKKFGKNVSKEVRDRQQKEVESKREQLISDIVDYMYPGLKTEEITYDMQKEADQKEAEREMLGREDIESKLKYFKKDKNGNREAKEIKVENPDIKLDKLLSAGKFDEIFEPTDRVIEWKTPEGQKGRIDKAKDPKKFKSVMEKINSGKTKTKVELKDVTNEVRALERYKENEKAEKERRKKEKQEEFAKKKQEEYKKMVRMKAFQRLVDMQRFEKYPFLTEEEIKNRYGFSDQEWKTITEQEEIKLPKKRGEKAISDFNKAVDDQVKYLIEGLNWQNNMKMREAEKNLGEIGEIDIDVLLGKDEEKGAREVEEFEKLAKGGKEETGGKMEEGKTAWEKDMEKKNEKAKKQAEKLTKKWKEDVSDMFRKAEEKRNERYANKEEKVIDEVKTVEEAKEITKESRWKRTKKFWKDTTIQDLIQPISSRIEKISPRIYLELMRFEQRVAVKTNTRMKQVEDFVKKMSEIRSKNKKDYLNITLHLLNGNVGTANKMLEKYGTSIPRQVLDEIWADAEDVGYTMNYEGFYYPRKVKDVQDFLDRFARTENKDIQGEIDKIIKKKEEQARKRGEEFTPQMKADLINQLLMEGEVEGISLGSGHMKQRKVESITKNMLEFYEDPVDALLQYITSMTEAVEKARFLGQGTRGEIKTLGEFITDEGITGSDVDELKDLLLSRFNYAPMGNFMRGLKVSANIIHLGSPSSALSQLADISFSLIENGLTNLVQGLANRYNLDLDALGITNRGEELKTQGKNETKREKVQRFTFKLTGFNMMDQFGKKSFVVSTLNKLIKYAKKNDPQLRKDLERWFDDPKMINEIIEDLKEGRMSENVNLFLFTKLADVQPLTRTQMPKTYLQAGNWRVLYAFKTFGIKQLDYLIQKSKRELATKPTAKALWTITAMLGIIMLCGAGTDEIKDFTLGRKSSSWIWRMIEGNDWSVSQMSDRFWDNLLKLVGMTKYSIYQARTQGIKSAIEDVFFSLPGLDIVTYPLQDIQEAMSEDGLDFSQASSWQLLPIVGKYGYWWAGAGQTKQQKALEKEKKKSKKKGSKNKGKIKL